MQDVLGQRGEVVAFAPDQLLGRYLDVARDPTARQGSIHEPAALRAKPAVSNREPVGSANSGDVK